MEKNPINSLSLYQERALYKVPLGLIAGLLALPSVIPAETLSPGDDACVSTTFSTINFRRKWRSRILDVERLYRPDLHDNGRQPCDAVRALGAP
jgi:hypothetical protein